MNYSSFLSLLVSGGGHVNSVSFLRSLSRCRVEELGGEAD